MSSRYLSRIGRFICLVLVALCLSLASIAAMPIAAGTQPSVSAQASKPTQWVQQGVEAYRSGDFLAAIALWQDALQAYPAEPSVLPNASHQAIIVQNLARAYQQVGQLSESLAYWQQALALYPPANAAAMATVLTEQAQIYVALGQPREAIALLCGATDWHEGDSSPCREGTALNLANRIGDRRLQAAALGSLSEAHRTLRAFNPALSYAARGLAIAQTQSDGELLALLHSSLGNTYSEQAREGYLLANATARRGATNRAQALYEGAKQQDQLARDHLQQSLPLLHRLANHEGEVRALLRLWVGLSRSGDRAAAAVFWQRAMGLWPRLLDNQAKVTMALRLVQRPRRLVTSEGLQEGPLTEIDSRSSRTLCQDIDPGESSQQLLEQTLALTTALANQRLKSFVWGELGHLYECRQAYGQALNYTQKARLAASDAFAALDGLHLWQWQAGRIYQKLGQFDEAIAAYEQATQTLETVRSQILATTQTLQFDFQDAIAPVYRELANLQLASIQADQPIANQTAASDRFSQALGNIDALQLSELQNYFGSDCLVPIAPQRLDKVDTLATARNADARSPLGDSTALINTVILRDQTAVTLTLPNGTRYLHWLKEDEASLHQAILELLFEIQDWSERDFNPERSQRMYDRLIRPFEPFLAAAPAINTLVFVQDGLLRNLPMAALYSGTEYLVERYAIATAPFLSLHNLTPANAANRKALFVGVTQAAEVNDTFYPALQFVPDEAAQVQAQLPQTTVLLDRDRLASELDLSSAPKQPQLKDALTRSLQSQPYSILHIATHGKFEAESTQSFLVLGDNSTITLRELDTLIRNVSPNTDPLDLIVLSACQTATGDDQATLGLAGVTIRAGAKSALATLWSVSDAATPNLVGEFYHSWVDDNLSKAQALQQAQKRIIASLGRRQSPGIWAAFTLVGNWQ